MAVKTIPNYYFGENTYGTKVNLAIRTDGIQFCRFYKFNGYGMSWTKWSRLDKDVKLFKREGEHFAKWGWNELKGIVNNKIRLPKI